MPWDLQISWSVFSLVSMESWCWVDFTGVFQLVRVAVWMETVQPPTSAPVIRVTRRNTCIPTYAYHAAHRGACMETALHQVSARVILVSHFSHYCSIDVTSTVLLQGQLLIDVRVTVFQKWWLTWRFCRSFYMKYQENSLRELPLATSNSLNFHQPVGHIANKYVLK